MGSYHYEMTITHDGPGGVEVRLVTDDPYVPPTYKTCYTRALSGSPDIELTDDGVAYFGSYADDINTALDNAMAEAMADPVFPAGSGDDGAWCTGDEDTLCQGAFANAVNVAVGDVSVGVNLSSIDIDVGDPQCDPNSTAEGPVYRGIRVSIIAPGAVESLDINDLLQNADPSKFSDPPLAASVLSTLIDAGGIAEYDAGEDNYELYVNMGGGAYARATITAGVSAMDIIGKPSPSDTATYTNGYLTFDNPLNNSADSTITGVSSMEGESGITVGSIISKLLGIDRHIDEQIYFDIDPTVDGPDIGYKPAGTGSGFPEPAHVAATGNFVVEYNDPVVTLVDPGQPHTACIWTVSYLNRRPFKPLCGLNDMQLDVGAATGYKHPPGQFPKCRFDLKAIDTGSS